MAACCAVEFFGVLLHKLVEFFGALVHKLSFCDDFKSKVARFFMFGGRALNKPNSAMIVGDKTSSASARVPTCSMFSD